MSEQATPPLSRDAEIDGQTPSTDAPETASTAEDQTEQRSDDDGPANGGTLPLDQTFELLKNQRRRHVVEVLDGTPGSVSLSDLAEQIAAWENDKDVAQISSSERKRVYVGLYQCHLPKMDDMDVVSFNKPRGTVAPAENMRSLEPYLGDDESDEQPTLDHLLLGVCVLGTGLLPVGTLLYSQSLFAVVATLVGVFGLTAFAATHLLRPDDA